MTWWPSVPTRAVMAPTIAGSSSTTRIRRGRVPITAAVPRLSISARPRRPPAARARSARLPRRRARTTAVPSSIPPGAAPRRARCRTPAPSRLPAGVGLEDPLAPLGRDARSLVVDRDPHHALDERPVQLHRVSGGAYFTAFSSRCSSTWRRRAGSARTCSRRDRTSVVRWRCEQRRESSRRSRRTRCEVDGLQLAAGWSGTTRTDSRIESTSRSRRSIWSTVPGVPRGAGLAPLDVARRAADERRLLGEQVRVRADDGERRPQLVGDERDQLRRAPGPAPRAARPAPRPRPGGGPSRRSRPAGPRSRTAGRRPRR